jgi:hypothetical protein
VPKENWRVPLFSVMPDFQTLYFAIPSRCDIYHPVAIKSISIVITVVLVRKEEAIGARK